MSTASFTPSLPGAATARRRCALRAARSSSSASSRTAVPPEKALADLYRRMSARDAKWLTRLILKDYQPVVLDRHAVLSSYSELLPMVLKVQNSLPSAVSFLQRQTHSRSLRQGPLGAR